MWFLFGFITLASFIVYSARNRFRANWKGHALTTREGVGFQFNIKSNKHRVVALLVGVKAPPRYDFVIEPERGFDRVAKWFGISREFQVGDPEFDRLIYIVSEDQRIHDILGIEPALRSALVDIVREEVSGCRFKALRCNSGRLWIEYRTPRKASEFSVGDVAEYVAPVLKKLSDAMGAIEQLAPPGWRDPFAYKAAVILAISSGLAMNGLAQLYGVMFDSASTRAVLPLISDSLLLGGSGLLVLSVAAILLLGRSSRTHLVLIELALVGFFGATATAFAELRNANMEFDKADAQIVERVVLSKSQNRRRRAPHEYVIVVDEWRPGIPGRVHIEVAGGVYHKVQPGTLVRIYEKPGYLGYPWIEKVVQKMPD